MNYTKKYDEELKQIAFYQQFPQILPFIGKNYETSGKIFLLGESHYFPKESTIHKNAEDWYKKSSSDLIAKIGFNEPRWINTREIADNEE